MPKKLRIGWFEVLFLVTALGSIVVAKTVYAYMVYGDASCAFANCVKVENLKR